MSLDQTIKNTAIAAFKILYDADISENQLQLQETRREFAGERTLMIFHLVRFSKKTPEQTAAEVGEYLKKHVEEVEGFNVVKGFLNLEIAVAYWLQELNLASDDQTFGFAPANSKPRVLVEFASPNTNKPLHLGHLRNIFLGDSVSRILAAAGHKITRVQIINDRGIHICKSMLAWQKFGGGETPQSSGLKGDHLVGKYYVIFDKKYKEEVASLEAKGMSAEEAAQQAPIMQEAREMLRKWEQKDPEVYALWSKMNGWVYEGFGHTYESIGAEFDKLYYESDTWLLGKEEVLKGLDKGVFYRKDDGSVWADLAAEGLDSKLLLRGDGTSVYMTQDLGTAILRYHDYPDMEKMVYTVGNEQEYHFKVLFILLGKLGFEWSDNCYHLSYGMVELPEGKMKSREGTVVDADDLIQEMAATAKSITEELGKLEGIDEPEKEALYRMIGLASIKYFLLKVDPKKNMLFDPKTSVDFNGNTGSFIQYTHARIASILRSADPAIYTSSAKLPEEVSEIEKRLMVKLEKYAAVIQESAQSFNPAVVANYLYELVKDFNSFYQSHPILKAESGSTVRFRVLLARRVALVIKSASSLLGMQVPERM